MPESSDAYEPLERRPIASRTTRPARWLTLRLAQLGVSPNAVSVSSMGFAAFAGMALFMTSHVETPLVIRLLWLSAIVGIQLRLLANLFDGMIAIHTQRASPIGELYNEFPDRVSDVLILVGLGYAQHASPVLGFIVAMLALLLPYIRALGKVAGAKQHYLGPMAKQHRMAAVTACCLWMLCVPGTWMHIGLESVDRGLSIPDLVMWLITAGSLVTVVRRLAAIHRDLTGNQHG